MRRRTYLPLVLSLQALVASSCDEPAHHALSLEVLAPASGATTHVVTPDTEHVFLVRVYNRSERESRVDLSASAPEGVTVAFDLPSQTSLWLGPNETRTVEVRVRVDAAYPFDDLELGVAAQGTVASGITGVTTSVATATASIFVMTPPDCSDFTIAVSPQNVSTVRGGSGTAGVYVKRGSFYPNGIVYLELLNSDSTVLAKAWFDSPWIFWPDSYTTLHYRVRSDVPLGTRKKFTVRGTAVDVEPMSRCSATFSVNVLGFGW